MAVLAAAVFSLDRVTASLDPLNTFDPLNSLDELDTILTNYKHSVLSDQEVELFDEAVNSVDRNTPQEGDKDSAGSRQRRARIHEPEKHAREYISRDGAPASRGGKSWDL